MARSSRRKPRAGDQARAGIRDLLVLHPALRPLALLRIRLCLRRLSRELALCPLPREREGGPGEVFRHAQSRRDQAPFGAAEAIRTRCDGSELLAQGTFRHRRAHRRARGHGPRALTMDASERSRADSERNSVARRAARYGRVGAAMGGAGLRIAAGRLLGPEAGGEVEGKLLAAALGSLKGPLMKVAQLASTIPDLL